MKIPAVCLLRSKRLAMLSLPIVLLSILYACDSGTPASAGKTSEEHERQVIDSTGPRPEFSIPIELRTDAPEAADFVDRFLSLCLNGDYTGYRRLVSRTTTPESKQRFQAIYLGLKLVTVESIERITPRKKSRLPAEVYRVVTNLEVRPSSRLEQRGIRRRIAILVFKEHDEWRMIPAPQRWQPVEEQPAAPQEPTEDEPEEADFPWDEDVDN